MKVLYLLLVSSARASFTVYPNALPDATDDYAVVAAAPNVTLSDVFAGVNNINAGAVLNASTGEVVYIVQQARVTDFGWDLGTLRFASGLNYHELVTWRLGTQVYVSRHFGFEETGALVDRTRYRCLKLGGSESECASTKRCVGLIEGHCLLSSVPQEQFLTLPSVMRMRLKVTKHDIYEWFKDNVVVGVFLLMLSQSALLFLARWSARGRASK